MVLIAATAAVTAVVVVGVIVALALVGGDGSPARAGATPRPSSSFSQDPATVQACQVRKLRTTVGARAEAVMRRSLEATAESDVVALREIHIRYAPGGTVPDYPTLRAAALAITTWCADNHIG